MNDLRFALRSLAQSPGFTAVAVLTLALGIGLSTTIFNGVNPLLFRPLPFHNPDTLVYLNEQNPKQGVPQMNVAYADFVHWQKENQVFSDLGVWNTTNFAIGTSDGPERIEGCQVSARLFTTLGLAPAMGRGLADGEDQPAASPVVLLGDGLWHRLFAGDPQVVGREITLNGIAHTVVGIMPPRVRFPHDADLWVPLVVPQPEKTHGHFRYRGAARLKSGISIAQAQADLDAINARIALETPLSNANVQALVRPIADGFLDEGLRAMGWTMLGAVAFVLAVACANVASLFLTRALGRRKEFAIRLALGAGRWRTIRQLLIESIVLGAIGGALGFLFSLWGLELVLRLVPVEIPYWIDMTLDARVVTFAIGISLLTSVLFGLAPAWQASNVDVQTGLSESARGSSGRHHQRLRGLLVVGEVALATLLLCGTGLMIRSLLNLQNVSPGFNPSRLAAFTVDLGSSPNSSAPARVSFFTELIERSRGLPGVQTAAATSALPLSGRNSTQVFAIHGQPPPAPGERPIGNLCVVSPGYFAAMEIPLLRGRDFTSGDSATSPKVLIIDAAFAQRYFNTADPLGQRIRWNPTDPASEREIVGVVSDVKHFGLDRDTRPGFYVPYAQNAWINMCVVFRTAAEQPLNTLPTIRAVLHELDPALPLYNARSMADIMGESYWIRRFLGRLMVVFAGLTVALAAVGIASVVAFAVSQRTHEIGVRMALGAQSGDVLRMILNQGAWLVGTGLVIGLTASIGLSRVLHNQLFGIHGADPLTLGGSALVFSLVALLACWGPARRATRLNPLEALRAE